MYEALSYWCMQASIFEGLEAYVSKAILTLKSDSLERSKQVTLRPLNPLNPLKTNSLETLKPLKILKATRWSICP